jgi:predicted helicase
MSCGNYFSQYLHLTEEQGAGVLPGNFVDVQVANELNQANIMNHYNDIMCFKNDSNTNQMGTLVVTDGQEIFNSYSTNTQGVMLRSDNHVQKVLPKGHGKSWIAAMPRHDN